MCWDITGVYIIYIVINDRVYDIINRWRRFVFAHCVRIYYVERKDESPVILKSRPNSDIQLSVRLRIFD